MVGSESQHTLDSLLSFLLPTTHLVHPPSHPAYPSLTSAISSLLLHPTLEAALHILNADLPSAHFLVRHMQAPPAVEGMLLHSILHRCEGDMQNARLWAGDVRDAVEGWVPKHAGEAELGKEVQEKIKGENGQEKGLVRFVYGEEKAMDVLIDDVDAFRRGRGEEEGAELEGRIRREIGKVVEWCKNKFGVEAFLDASGAWVRHSEEVRKTGEDMVSGDRGWRKF